MLATVREYSVVMRSVAFVCVCVSVCLSVLSVSNFWQPDLHCVQKVERQSAWMSKSKKGGLDQYGKV